MAQAAKSQEPSMEEILASIRRIIAEDDPEKSQQRPAEAAGPDAASDAGPPTGRRDEELSHSTPSYSAPVAAGPQHETRSAILDLTESMASSAPRPPAPTFNSNARVARPALLPEVVEGAEATFDPADAKEDAKQTASGLMQPGGEQDEARGGLVSSATSAAVDSAFNALAQTVLVQNARTLEDLVREMLRPMLKVWLDDNLPGLVERLVRAEIERVSRGRSS
jgi:cell pole-organizing protein PopZ